MRMALKSEPITSSSTMNSTSAKSHNHHQNRFGSSNTRMATGMLITFGLVATMFANVHCVAGKFRYEFQFWQNTLFHSTTKKKPKWIFDYLSFLFIQINIKKNNNNNTESNMADKEQVQPSPSASGLVKRSAPMQQMHSIMRFGRAPHNIMHFGKRAMGSNSAEMDSVYDTLGDGSSDLMDSSVNTVPEWIVANLLGNGQRMLSNGISRTRYLLVPIPVRETSSPYTYYSPNSYPSPSASVVYPSKSLSSSSMQNIPIKKAKLSDEGDNVFMHFG